MYYKYWSLDTAPFDNVPDPKMYCNLNPSIEDAISEIIFAIAEGNDCLAVMVGDIGTGKTLALRVIMDELPTERFDLVFVTNPDMTFVQLLREIVGQLIKKKVGIRQKDELFEEFNRLLFEAAAQGKKVVIFIDEANTIKPSILQDLRMLTNMQDDERNLVSIVLAGQPELGKRITSRAMENLYQRVGVLCRITGFSSPKEVGEYIKYRLSLVGGHREIFSTDAIEAIWRYSRGIPRLINKLAKLALKAGETNELPQLDGDIIKKLATMFDQKASQKKVSKAPSKKTATEDQDESETNQPAPSEDMEPISAELTTKQTRDKPSVTHTAPTGETKTSGQKPFHERKEVSKCSVEVVRGLPSDVLGRLTSMHDEEIIKMAASLAAKATEAKEIEILKGAGDPMDFWENTRDEIASILMLIRHRSIPANSLQ